MHSRSLGIKTKFLNVFRRAFVKVRPLENYLVRRTIGETNNFWVRLSPPHYLYPRGSQREVTRNGISYSLDISDAMEHAVYFGYREKAHEQLYRMAAGKNLLIDVGTNLGAVCLNLAKGQPGSTIYSFEPDLDNFNKAKRNIEANAVRNIHLINKGLGSSPAQVTFVSPDPTNEGMKRVAAVSETIAGLHDQVIDIITLDDFAAQNQLQPIELIKIDVEGYEMHVLAGASRILEQDRPALFIEVDDQMLRSQTSSAKELIQHLTEKGYKSYRAEDGVKIDSNHDFTNCHFDIVCEVA